MKSSTFTSRLPLELASLTLASSATNMAGGSLA
jgi:hypothetical protein